MFPSRQELDISPRDFGGTRRRSPKAFESVAIRFIAEYGPLMEVPFRRQSAVDAGTVKARRAVASTHELQRIDNRVWWKKPGLWRHDAHEPGARPTTGVWDAAWGASSFPAEQLRELWLLDPTFLESGWRFNAIGSQEYAGRPGIHVHARQIDPTVPPADHVPWVDAFSMIVDEERDILLRCAGLIDGQEACTQFATEMYFDEHIPDDVFSYRPMSGLRFQNP